MKSKRLGILFTMLSAVIFGFTPILARSAYDGGANGISMTFLRGLLELPFLYVLVRMKGIPLRLTPERLKSVLIAGLLGTTLTTLTLYMSYSYIPVGMATTLHFIYPVLVSAACIVFFKEKMNGKKLAALLIGTAGIALFFEPGSGKAFGMFLAILSGFTYAFYILYLDRSGLKNMYYFQLSFYLCCIMAPATGIFGLATGQLSLNLTPKAWFFAVLVAIFASIGGLSLFQLGISMTGPSTAAILSTLEPITSVILGILILGETTSATKITGCVCIAASVILIALSETKANTATTQEPPDES